jgi:hypothetical protein
VTKSDKKSDQKVTKKVTKKMQVFVFRVDVFKIFRVSSFFRVPRFFRVSRVCRLAGLKPASVDSWMVRLYTMYAR